MMYEEEISGGYFFDLHGKLMKNVTQDLWYYDGTLYHWLDYSGTHGRMFYQQGTDPEWMRSHLNEALHHSYLWKVVQMVREQKGFDFLDIPLSAWMFTPERAKALWDLYHLLCPEPGDPRTYQVVLVKSGTMWYRLQRGLMGTNRYWVVYNTDANQMVAMELSPAHWMAEDHLSDLVLSLKYRKTPGQIDLLDIPLSAWQITSQEE